MMRITDHAVSRLSGFTVTRGPPRADLCTQLRADLGTATESPAHKHNNSTPAFTRFAYIARAHWHGTVTH